MIRLEPAVASYEGRDDALKKREALETLHRFLTESSASVDHISSKAKT